MKKYKIILGILFVIAVVIGFARWKEEQDRFVGKRVREDQIIAYRDSAGPFQGPEDIMNVSGIKQSAFDKIKDKIKV